MLKCTICGGTYQPTTSDGLTYYHACPPLSLPELADAVAHGKVALPVDPATGQPEAVDVAHARRLYTRANARDENVKPDGSPKHGGPKPQTVPDPPSPVVTV